MKKGKKIVIGVAAVAVVAGGLRSIRRKPRRGTASSGFGYKGGDRRCGRNCGCNRNGGQ